MSENVISEKLREAEKTKKRFLCFLVVQKFRPKENMDAKTLSFHMSVLAIKLDDGLRDGITNMNIIPYDYGFQAL